MSLLRPSVIHQHKTNKINKHIHYAIECSYMQEFTCDVYQVI